MALYGRIVAARRTMSRPCRSARRRFEATRGDAMSANTYKLIELVGSSPNSSDEAVRNAIAKASATIKNMDWFEVTETRGHLKDGKVAHFQVTLKVGFRIE
jgi:flavin-binding protein dodecin